MPALLNLPVVFRRFNEGLSLCPRLTVPLSFLSWSPPSFSFLRCSPLNLIFLWLPPLKPLVTSCAMLLKNPELPMPVSSLMVSLNSLLLMFFQLTVRSSSKPTLPSCALSSPTAQFLGISAVTIPILVLFLRPVGLLSTMNLNRGNTPASLFSLRVLPAHASKFSLVTVNKPVQGRVATFCVNLYSSVSPIKELVALMALLPSFLLRCWLLSLQLLQMKAPFHSSTLQDQILSLSYLLSPHKSSLLPATPKTVRTAEGHVPTAGVLLHLILPHSLRRCPADAYQVAMHYPHLHRPDGAGVAYGHYEEPPRQIRDSRLPIDMQGRTHPISGYRLVHWSPDLKPGLSNNHMDQSSRDSVLTVAAVLSYFTARSVRLDNESSKLLLLTPHNDTVYDLQDALGASCLQLPAHAL